MRTYTRWVTSVIMVSFFLIIGGLIPYDTDAAEPLLQQGSGNIFSEVRSERSWQMERTRKVTDPEQVKRYLEELNQGEYDDWRLPTKSELSRLFDLFDSRRNGDVKIRLEGYYWLADNDGIPYPAAWEVGDGCGPGRKFYKGKRAYIRAVRP